MSQENQGKKTTIEEGTEFKGTLSARHPVMVMGKVEGDLTGPAVHVSETGVVAGKIKVGELHSSGEIAGEIEADEVHLSGRVRDKTIVRAKQIEVHLTAADAAGGVLLGDCDFEVGEVPDKAAVIAAAAGARNGAPAPRPEAAVAQELPADGTASRKARKQAERAAER
jgi:cytoskeletal protein CcmA (bactofilin family)